jgi:hypothetical protein
MNAENSRSASTASSSGSARRSGLPKTDESCQGNGRPHNVEDVHFEQAGEVGATAQKIGLEPKKIRQGEYLQATVSDGPPRLLEIAGSPVL